MLPYAAPIYNSSLKIWHQPLKSPTLKKSLGQFILDKLNEFDPNKIIEINYDNDKELSAGELKALIINFSKNLIDLGIIKNDRIALFSTMTSYTTPIVFSAYVIGASVTPIDNLSNDDIIEVILQKLDPNVIIYDDEFKDRVFNIVKNIKLSNFKLAISADSDSNINSVRNLLCKDVNCKFEIPMFNPDEVCGAILLTSGSTGPPKQLMLSHSLLALVVDTWWPANETSKIYIASPLRWVSQFSAMLQPIFNKSTRIFTRKHHSPQLCFNVIEKYQITHFFGVTGLIINLLNYANQKEEKFLQTIKYIMTSGERISEYIKDSIKNYIVEAQLIRVYGMTEMAGCISSNLFVKNDNGTGYIVPGMRLKIIDDQNKSLEFNCNGRICLRTDVPLLGYWNNVEADKKSFLNDWFITGDYGKMDKESRLHVYNRYQDLISIKNDKIVPSIIEEVLDNHPAISVSCVIGVPITQRNKEAIPVAFIKLISKKMNLVTKQEILDYLEYNNQIYPRHIYFLTEFPLISCGKIDKNKLINIIQTDFK